MSWYVIPNVIKFIHPFYTLSKLEVSSSSLRLFIFFPFPRSLQMERSFRKIIIVLRCLSLNMHPLLQTDLSSRFKPALHRRIYFTLARKREKESNGERERKRTHVFYRIRIFLSKVLPVQE